MLKLKVNGKQNEIPKDVTSVADLLRFYQLDSRAVIVELNEKIIDRESYNDTKIKEGDRVELVQFVGGG